MSPCIPAKQQVECSSCLRFRETTYTVHRRIPIIDASTVTKPDQPCPMWKPE